MFNNLNYDKSEELADRIERIISRPLFIACYTIDPNMLKLQLIDYLALHFGADKEFGDNYADVVTQAVEAIIRRTHITPREAKIFATDLANKMETLLESVQADRQVKEMRW